MNKFINNQEFMVELFDNQDIAERAAEIRDAILDVQSLRLTDVAVKMEGKSDAGYRRIQWFLKTVDPHSALWRVFQAEALFWLVRLAQAEVVYLCWAAGCYLEDRF